MPYVTFYEYCPVTAKKETRDITLFSNNNEFRLPTGSYVFIELFCDECDCRRVFFNVVKGNDTVAVICWGWESLDFYAEWLGNDDEDLITDLKGPVLNSMSSRSSIAPQVLEMFVKVLLNDNLYVERVKKHYEQFRLEINNKKKRKKRNAI